MSWFNQKPKKKVLLTRWDNTVESCDVKDSQSGMLVSTLYSDKYYLLQSDGKVFMNPDKSWLPQSGFTFEEMQSFKMERKIDG